MNSSPLLRVEGLKVYFSDEEKTSRAVDGCGFVVDSGEVVCLVGESGCGKTVSALAVMGLVPCPPGEIREGTINFKGKNLLEISEETFRAIRGKEISMIFQEPMTSLNPVFTIGDQILEILKVHETMREDEARQKVVSLLHDVGMPSPEQRINDYPHQLSGGQRQRVMIAMALACGPDLVIADEPTTALDVTVQAQILALFRKLQAQRKMAVLLITHNLGVVAEIAHRIYVMYAGVITESGDARQIFYDPCHPYTMALLASVPSRSKKGRQLYSIPGCVPDPAYKPEGCPFHPRCPYAEKVCENMFPEMIAFEPDHHVRCPITHRLRQSGTLPETERHLGLVGRNPHAVECR
jgi:peptide/nickel transport system ATP-binding protein/oligopeptide transport system ATP-binding protein